MSNLVKPEQVSLEQVLRSKLILLDGSANERSDFCHHTAHTGDYRELQKEELIAELKRVEQFSRILKNPRIKLSPGVFEELEGYKRHISFLSEKLKESPFQLKLRKSRDFMCPCTRSEEYREEVKKAKSNKKLLDRLERKVISSQESARKKRLIIQDQKYTLLSDMICLISQAGDLKKDSSKSYGERPKNPNRSNTDERIVASSYWISLDAKTDPSIFTGDNDFKRLLGVTPRLMCSDQFSEDNRDFTISLLQRPPTLYWIKHNSSEPKIFSYTMRDLMSIHEKKAIELEGRPELMKELGCLWKRFSEVKYQTIPPLQQPIPQPLQHQQ